MLNNISEQISKEVKRLQLENRRLLTDQDVLKQRTEELEQEKPAKRKGDECQTMNHLLEDKKKAYDQPLESVQSLVEFQGDYEFDEQDEHGDIMRELD